MNATVRQLKQRISEMQPLRLDERALPTHPALAPLLPGGALRRGSRVAVQGSLQLALALLGAVSTSGAWCGAIGVPALGFEAAASLGVALDRFVLVPRPGAHAMSIAGTLSEVLTTVLLCPSKRDTPGDVERLAARLRDHGTALIVLGEWPRAETSLRVLRTRWSGLGEGSGILDTQELEVRSEDRRGALTHTVRFETGRIAERPSTAVVPLPGLSGQRDLLSTGRPR